VEIPDIESNKVEYNEETAYGVNICGDIYS